MKKEITFEQIIELMDAAINSAKESCSSVKTYIYNNHPEHYRIDIFVQRNELGNFNEHYIIQYDATTKLVGLVDRDYFDLVYDDIRVNNHQEDLLFDKINTITDMWYFNSINNINGFISKYASKKK